VCKRCAGIAAGRATLASGGNRLLYMCSSDRESGRDTGEGMRAAAWRGYDLLERVKRPEGATEDAGDWIRAATGMRTGRRGWDKTLFLQISPQSPRADPSRGVRETASHSLSAITGTRSLTPLSRFRVSDTCWVQL
jgi:hypothetical protein